MLEVKSEEWKVKSCGQQGHWSLWSLNFPTQQPWKGGIVSYLCFSVFIGLTPFSIMSPLQGSEWLYNYLIDRVYTLSYTMPPLRG